MRKEIGLMEGMKKITKEYVKGMQYGYYIAKEVE
ncbi:hypothetical protein LMOSLCC2479_2365 [Listeria monocytogenes SLCC2479]|nr:hypothetical protein LMOSLCC2372_2368 [Listeria monocytogenes SLCC2372]CBY58636.1 hypothetical protein LMOSLCC2479_2365 [Listeria monocytogenes SLCC2479]